MEDKKNNAPLRVLCVFGSLDQGGAETMCMNLYRHIDRSRIQFDFVTHSGPGGAYENEIKSLGGKVYYCPAYRVINDLSYRIWWRNHFHQHPEHRLIHGHYFSLSPVYFKIAHQFGCITIGHSHCTSPIGKRGVKESLFFLYCKQVERNSDYCLACSKAAGEFLFKKKHFQVLNNAIETESFAYNEETRKRIREAYSLNNKYVVVNVGRFVSSKNHVFMIDVFEKLLSMNHNAYMILIGDGPDKQEIMNLVSKKGLVNTIAFWGNRYDVPDLLNAMDVFLFPSQFEGLGIVAIEAQASGLPVICSDSIPEEATITPLIERLSLNESIDVWARCLNKYSRDFKRTNMREQVVDAGYDINSTAGWLQKFYLGISKVLTPN